MKIVVITGSTRGIGFGLAGALLAEGCAVVISGRSAESAHKAVAELEKKYDSARILGCACDVTEYRQVAALWDQTQSHFGKIDIWINNAGLGHPPANFWELPPEMADKIVRTNLVGSMFGARVALKGMLEQGFGSLYFMEGRGSNGGRTKGLSLYGSTKYGLRYLTESLIQETKGLSVLVGALSPGMVVTDLLVGQFEGRPEAWARAQPIFNILADRVETVTPWLAEKILSNRKTGVRFAWLTRPKLAWRFLMAPLHRRNLFPDPERPSSGDSYHG